MKTGMLYNPTLKIVFCIGCIFAILTVTFYLGVVSRILLHKKDVHHRRMHLLCETDYQVLLDTCIELSRKVETEEIKADWYYIRRNQDAEEYGFPKVILDIAPSYIIIENDGSITLEMEGGFNHFGITTRSSFGDRELIHGLWYYDENYRYTPKYRSKIEDMIKNNKYLNEYEKQE